MRVQEAFPVDYFVFSCIAPNFPAEKKWMWCWFQTIWAAHLDELFILQLLFLFTVFLTCFRPPRAIARAEMYLNEQKWIFCLFYQSRYFNLKEISGSQRWANNSVFEYYSNNIQIPKYSYSYSDDIFKPNNIRVRIRVIFSNRIIFVFVFGWFFQTE